jgi:LEA14-like dessication related protein
MRKLSYVLLATILGVSAACATFGRGAFQNPVVTLKDVRINGLGLTGGSLDVVLNVYNPNGYRLDATRMTYKLYVDTIPFGTGALDSSFTVPKGDSMQVRLPLSFNWAGIGQAGRQLMNTGAVNYRVTGDLTVGSSVGTFTLPYDRTGRFSTLGGASRD